MPLRAAVPLPALFLLLGALLAMPAAAQAQPAEALRIVGGPGPGCIAGATELPPEGPGWLTIRRSRSFFWGAPSTIAGLQLLAAQARAAGLPTLYMNDISKPRGGPFPGIHASHMLGLDADVWLDLHPKAPLTAAERDALEVESLVIPNGRGVEPTRWLPGHLTLIRLAATLPGTDRVLVNPAIKRQLCDVAGSDRAWLRRVRPWYGHAAHMHIHFACPPGQAECHDQPPPPPGDGCDASLQWWFDRLDAPPGPTTPPRPVVLPAACAAIMAGPGTPGRPGQ